MTFQIGDLVSGLVDGELLSGRVIDVSPDGGYTVRYDAPGSRRRPVARLRLYQQHSLEQPVRADKSEA